MSPQAFTARPVTGVREVAGHHRRRAAQEGEGRGQHAGVAHRHQLLNARDVLLLKDRNGIGPVGALRSGHGRCAAPSRAEPCRPPAARRWMDAWLRRCRSASPAAARPTAGSSWDRCFPHADNVHRRPLVARATKGRADMTFNWSGRRRAHERYGPASIALPAVGLRGAVGHGPLHDAAFANEGGRNPPIGTQSLGLPAYTSAPCRG